MFAGFVAPTTLLHGLAVGEWPEPGFLNGCARDLHEVSVCMLGLVVHDGGAPIRVVQLTGDEGQSVHFHLGISGFELCAEYFVCSVEDGSQVVVAASARLVQPGARIRVCLGRTGR